MMLKINTNFKKGISWSMAILTAFSLFSYLTFIPTQSFATEETRTLADITKMQEMNKHICDNTKDLEAQYQLEDIRDGKIYWVSKLKDGNCWMTQNLDFDIPEYLDPADSDVTIAAANEAGVSVTDGKVATGISGPTAIDAWPTSGTDTNYTKNYAALDKDYIYAGPKNDHGFNDTNNCTSVTSVTDSKCNGYFKQLNEYPANEQVDAMHYHTGNYYSYSATTMGSADQEADDGYNATMSICPKGWRLPTSGNNTGEFQALMQAYGWSTEKNQVGIVNTMNNNKGIYGAPLYFVYGGVLNSGKLLSAGNNGRYWSSATFANHSNGLARAYHLYFISYALPSNDASRYLGFSVRCIFNPAILTSEDLSSGSTSSANISVTVSPVISIDATSSMEEEVDFTTIARGDISATISSNQNYKVLLGTSQSTLEQDPKLTNHNIPMVENDQSIVAGIGKWGVRKLTNSSDIKKESITDEYDRTINQVTVATADTNITNTTATGTTISTSANYSPIGLFAVDSDNNTIKDNSILFYDAGESGISKVVFPVAIAVDAKLPGGKYFTEVVITAVAN